MKVAVVGATGAVGREMIRILEERSFPVDELLPLASSRSAGTTVSFRGEPYEVRELSLDLLRGVDVALVSAGAFRVEIVHPRGGGERHGVHRQLQRLPHGSRRAVDDPGGQPRVARGIAAHHRGAELHHDHGAARGGAAASRRRLTSLVLSSYQSVSGAGHTGVSELLDQVEKLRGDEASLAHPVHEALPTGPVFGKTIAYNVVAKIGDFEADGFTGEESKMMAEPRKILGMPDLPVVATSVRVPVLAGHGASILAEFERSISVRDARELLEAAPGVELWDDPKKDVYPSPLDSAGLDVALVGRIRQVPGRPDALALFSCADNLRKGAALDAVQIAEHLFAR